MAHIMALDDILDAVILIKKILERKGHTVSIFTDEEEAIAHAGSKPVDLAILDIKLKKMSGIEVLAKLKEMDSSIRAIMLTGYPTIETARAALELGASEYCVKPIDKQELEMKVALALNRS